MFDYKNIFNLSSDLEEALSKIISTVEENKITVRQLTINSDKDISLFVIMNHNDFISFCKEDYQYYEDIINSLNKYNCFYQLGNGIFNSTDLYPVFPYLEEFFEMLDNWRVQNSRVTLDEDIVSKATQSYLEKLNSIKEKKLKK